jgi:hypothetical protein
MSLSKLPFILFDGFVHFWGKLVGGWILKILEFLGFLDFLVVVVVVR